MTDDRTRWVDKVQKLLAKAESTTSEAEADALFAKASDLITRWRIEDGELAAAGRLDDELGSDVIVLGSYTPVADCVAIKAVLEPLGVRVAFKAYSPGSPARARLYGWQSDREKALLMWASITVQLAGAMRRAEPAGLDRSDTRTWRQSFKYAYAQRVGQWLRDAVVVSKDTVVAEHGGSKSTTALVLASRHREVDRFFSSSTGRARSTSFKTDLRGLVAGQKAADRADLGQTSRLAGRGRRELAR